MSLLRFRAFGAWLPDVFLSALAWFGAANVVAGLLGGANRNDLWVRGPAAPGGLLDALVLLFAVGVLAGPRLGLRLRAACRAATVVLAVLCAWDAAVVARAIQSGRLAAGSLLSLSLVLAFVLTLRAWRPYVARPAGPPTRWRRMVRLTGVGAAGTVLVLAHLLTFGASDYRRPADVAVVLGAAVRPDGSPSGALADRTRTACRLYHEGTVGRLLLTGGRNPAMPLSEPACMARLALAEGVPQDALILDETGATSKASLATVARLAAASSWRRVLLVSHDYHLARLHLLSRNLGVEACTVPAVETVPWPSKPAFVLREVVAWAWHFLRTAPGGGAVARP